MDVPPIIQTSATDRTGNKMSETVISGVTLRIGSWQVFPAGDLLPEAAAEYFSAPEDIPDGKPLVFNDFMSDLATVFPDFKPGTSTAVARTTVHCDTDCRILISAGSDWWMYGFVNGKPFGDTDAIGNGAHPITSLDHFYTVELKAGKNIILFYLKAGLTWSFGVRFFPLPANYPADYRVMQRICQAALPPEFTLLHEPVVHGVSATQAKITTEFSFPVPAMLRLREKNGADCREFRNTVCGQWECSQMHCFTPDGLKANTAYDYEICCRDLLSAEDKVIFSGTFTTFPDRKQVHTFTAFSDLQFPSEIKRKVLCRTLNNTPAKSSDFMVSLGDMASGFADFSMAYFTDFTDILREKGYDRPLVFARGNHELWGEESSLYSNFLGRPYGTFSYGDVFYFVLDTGEDQPRRQSPGHNTQRSYLEKYYREQHDFLAAAIRTPECRNARFRIVLAHACPFEFEFPFYAENIRNFAGEFFYGDDPECRIDLWLCGDVHSPYRYDPAAGEICGMAAGRKRPALPTVNDLRDIRFPVYVNDGPGCAGSDFSAVMVTCGEENISLNCCNEYGQVVDQITVVPGKPFEVKQSDYELLWRNK